MKATISSDRRTLLIEVDADERRALVDLGDTICRDSVLHFFLEPIVADGKLDWVRPEDTGDLTDAPMLGIRDSNPDHPDELGQVTERWAYMAYQVISPLEDLRDNGRAVFVSS